MREKKSIVDELWQLNDEWVRSPGPNHNEIERILSRSAELASQLPRCEREWWTRLGLCDGLYDLNTLLIDGRGTALSAFFGLLPENACVWPSYPYGGWESKDGVYLIPPLDDPYCPLWHDGFERTEWEQTAFLPCTAKVMDLLPIFESEENVYSWSSNTVGATLDEFKGWVYRIVQVLQIVPWIGFQGGEESGWLITFWSPQSLDLLDRIINSLHERRVSYGAIRVESTKRKRPIWMECNWRN
jgi:hypothetical protein